MSPHREVGTCGCAEHQAADRLKAIIKEKDQEIARLNERLIKAHERRWEWERLGTDQRIRRFNNV